MSFAITILICALLYAWADTPQRKIREHEKKENLKKRIKNQDHRITYKELAEKRHDLTTARALIKLGLVRRGPDPMEEQIKDIYAGVDFSNNFRYNAIASTYGLHPDDPSFVGKDVHDGKQLRYKAMVEEEHRLYERAKREKMEMIKELEELGGKAPALTDTNLSKYEP